MNLYKATFLLFLLITRAEVYAFPFLEGVEASTKSGLRVGLVLSGGGAKGAAEVGALKVIEEAGIPIHCIAGTSIGSIVGGLYACGYRANELDSLFRSQEWLSLLADRDEKEKNRLYSERDGVTYVLGFPISRKQSKEKPSIGALNGERVEALLDSMIRQRVGDKVSFDSLPIPFRCVATDFNTFEEVVLGQGRLSKAMRASMAIPGAYKPVRMDGRTLVDGGVVNNLPVDVVKQMGADIVIAIDLTQSRHETRDFSLKEMLGIDGVLDWLVSRPDWKRYNENLKLVDICINPMLGSYGPTSFNAAAIAAMLHRGEDSARQHWKKLLNIKKRLNP